MANWSVSFDAELFRLVGPDKGKFDVGEAVFGGKDCWLAALEEGFDGLGSKEAEAEDVGDVGGAEAGLGGEGFDGLALACHDDAAVAGGLDNDALFDQILQIGGRYASSGISRC